MIKTKTWSENSVLSLKVDKMTDDKTVDAIKDKLRGSVQKVDMRK